jgi:hypothetical protein
MTSLQTETAIETLSDLFGKPKWELNPPEGFNRDVFLAGWDEELRKYSETQVKKACLRYGKYAKTRTFPTLMHILAQLVDEEPEPQDGTPETKKNTFMDELAQYRSRCIQNGFNGHLCLSSDVDEAMRRVMDEINSEYPPEKHWETRSASDLIGLALRNGVFWDKLDAHLRHIVEMRVSYSASGVVGELFDLPKTFKSTEERKCA